MLSFKKSGEMNPTPETFSKLLGFAEKSHSRLSRSSVVVFVAYHTDVPFWPSRKLVIIISAGIAK